MTPGRWARIKEIFSEALETPEAERAAYLESACAGDADLRAEVERLLADHATGTLPSPAAAVLNQVPALAPGDMLAQYRVDAKLGEGGMGVVYRAYDTRLERPVALKLLLPDPDRQQRLLREARAASALNHTNIVTIHEIGTAHGVDFIAMEYVEGRPLSKLIPSKGLPVETALDYAIQIADALAHAHAAGVVHRDLKPANIMVASEGRVKLLDFGLARRRPGAESATASLTVPGTITGTPAYMSPEQAEGKKADHRSDIFSFGVVMYEMLSGRRAFQGDSTLAVLGAVLREDPPPLRDVPHELERLVFFCLRKDPGRRLQHIDDVKLQLEAINSEPRAGQNLTTRAQSRAKVRPVLVLLSMFVAMLVPAVVFWMVRSRTVDDRGAAGPQWLPLTSYPGHEKYPDFSPDGSQVVFSWDGPSQDNFDIYVKLVDDITPLRLTTNPAPEVSPVWSPDGRSIAFIRQDRQGGSTLVLIPALGGPERILLDDLAPYPNLYQPGRHLSWSPDGKWIAVSRSRSIFLVSRDTGETRRLTSPPGVPGCSDLAPALSRDGSTLAFIRKYSYGVQDLHLVALSQGPPEKNEPVRRTFLKQMMSSPAWSPDGRELIVAAGASGDRQRLWRVRASDGGDPTPLASAGFDGSEPALSAKGGRLAFTRHFSDSNIWRLHLPGPLNSPGVASRPPVRLLSSTRTETNPQYSSDGRRIAYESDVSGRRGVWICDADGSNAIELFGRAGAHSGTPRWSPDGQRLVFDSNVEHHWDIYLAGVRGGQPVRLTTDPAEDHCPSWSRDGRWVYFHSNRSGRGQIWKMPVTAAESDESAIQVTRNGGHLAFEGTDGRYLYYTRSPLNTGIWRVPVSGGEETEIIPSVVPRNFVVVGGGIYYELPAETHDTFGIWFFSFVTGGRKLIAQIPGTPGIGLTISPDGRSILYAKLDHTGSDLMLVEGTW